jgi:hypothetical protein
MTHTETASPETLSPAQHRTLHKTIHIFLNDRFAGQVG